KKMGKKAAIITGRTSKIVENRAQDLGITHIYQGVHNKDEILQNILDEENLSMKNVAAIGDDLNDYKMLNAVGLSFVPNDASSYVKKIANVVCQNNGGDGAVREMLEYIFKYEGKEEDFINLWA
ncbi:MAG: HAD hydrolase family protein, partial [Campylobacterota bacterium]|nr:HAD hydrolase family protein [Campylobacterota bacterium]